MTSVIRIGICDDDALVRRLLANTISHAADMEVVAVCDTGEDAVALDEPIDLWLMDLRLPGMSGRRASEILTKRVPKPKVLLLTAFGDDRVADTLEAGASGYLLKDSRPENLIAAIRAVAAGFSVSTVEVMRSALGGAAATPQVQLPDDLDPLDRRIVQEILRGAAYGEIAQLVNMSESGLKKRVSALMRRMGVKSRPELMARLQQPRNR